MVLVLALVYVIIILLTHLFGLDIYFQQEVLVPVIVGMHLVVVGLRLDIVIINYFGSYLDKIQSR